MELIKIKNKSKKRIARGIAGKGSNTAGRGTKGQKSRTGFNLPRFFEGGQSTIIKRLPKKRGFKLYQPKPQIVNINDIDKKYKDGEKVTPQTLYQKGLLNEKADKVKILGEGKLEKKIIFQGCLLSKKIADLIKNNSRSRKEPKLK